MSSGPMFTPAAERMFAVRDERYRALAREDPERHPPLQRTWQDLEEVRRREAEANPHWMDERACNRFHRNMMLSGGRLDVMEALCRGESVPLEVLDPEQVRRYGLR